MGFPHDGDLGEDDLKGSVRLGIYLRQLRQGYGYSLRRVEEKARLAGGEIDNSQLSRYEKGRCYPSFDKLRVLADIFNVSVQSFSDIVDLEQFEQFRPDSEVFDELMTRANDEAEHGNYAKAYAAYQKAVEVVEAEEPDLDGHATRLGRVRYGLARALLRLGKIALAETELRNILRIGGEVEPTLIMKTLLQLTNAHAELGDRFLARLEAEKCLGLSREVADAHYVAYSQHALGRIAYEDDEFDGALVWFRDAGALYEEVGDNAGAVMMKVNIGACHVALGRFKIGVKLLQEALRSARLEGLRRTAALAVSKLMEAEFAQKHFDRARQYVREVDALAGGEDENDRYVDLLFNAAFYLWEISRLEASVVQEKIAFGRLKYLRSSLERMTPEVERFDAFVGQRRGRELLA